MSMTPSGVFAFTPATRSPSRMTSIASVDIITLSEANCLPRSRRKLRKSHCGMKAMNGYFTWSRLRSAIRTELSAEHPVHLLQALMRQLEEAFDQPELVHHLQGRGMHGVAAKIAEEVGVLFQHHDIDAGAAEQIAEHHSGGPAADDATTYFHRLS